MATGVILGCTAIALAAIGTVPSLATGGLGFIGGLFLALGACERWGGY